MELRQLQYLVAVVEEGSFTKAAARLHVAQPWVSAQVRQLEKQLGQRLIDRTSAGARPTEIGRAVLPHARAALDQVAAVGHVVEQLTGLLAGHVRVGSVPSVASPDADLPCLLAGFSRQHPAVEITLTEAASDRLLEALMAGELDLALISESSTPPVTIATHTVAEEPLVAAVSPTDPLAGRRTISLKELAAQRLISLAPGSGLRRRLDDACAAAGLTPQIAFEASDPQRLVQLAALGLGVAILTQAAAHKHPADVQPIAIVRPALHARLQLAWRAEQPASPAASALIAYARDQWPNSHPRDT